MDSPQTRFATEDRIGARFLALCLGLRIETLRARNGQTVYALWPDDGYTWELADPPVSTTWAGIHRVLRLVAESARL